MAPRHVTSGTLAGRRIERRRLGDSSRDFGESLIAKKAQITANKLFGRGISLSSSALQTARDYRERADQLRVLAGSYSDEQAKRDLLSLAAQWDSMAERLEQRRAGE